MITLDTSAVVAFVAGERERGTVVRSIVEAERGPFLVPATVLCEIGYLAEKRGGPQSVDAVLRDIESGAFALDCGERDVARVRHLIARYADLRLGSADAFVAACAERNGGRVLTFDRRHFDILSRELGLTVLP